MKKASITDAKNNLSSLIDGLKGGSPVLIVDRGRPVARLEAVTGLLPAGDQGRLARLVRDGIVRPARAPASKATMASQPPRPEHGASALRALIDDRRAGR
jgi:antitoxin (DNA-binding transcriptional repressor) of toxin-antitoxin stability system